jgi:putative oxidoreductase
MENFGLLLLRLMAGAGMLVLHGLPKIEKYSEYVTQFPDPFGVGPAMSLNLAIFAEVVCAALVALGLFSRLALIPLMVTMAVAFFIIHGADPMQKKELALFYLVVYGALFGTGPGTISFQNIFKISAGRFSWLLK